MKLDTRGTATTNVNPLSSWNIIQVRPRRARVSVGFKRPQRLLEERQKIPRIGLRKFRSTRRVWFRFGIPSRVPRMGHRFVDLQSRGTRCDQQRVAIRARIEARASPVRSCRSRGQYFLAARRSRLQSFMNATRCILYRKCSDANFRYF